MRNSVYIFLIVFVLFLIHIFLCTRRNRYLGLVIPGANLLFSIIVSLLISDFFTAIIVLIITSIPLVLWLVTYQKCRNKLDQLQIKEINRMKIRDI